jgi:GAF domain-containing protein
MTVPLNYQDDLVGTLNLAIMNPDEFTAEHQNIALQVADQLAIAVRQADLYQQVQQYANELEQRVIDRTRELSTLYDITSVASMTMDSQRMLDRMLEQVLIALRCQVGVIYLANESTREPQVHALRGLQTDQDVARIEALLLDNKLMERVLESAQPVMVPDLDNDPRLVNGSGLDGVSSYAGTLIRGGGHLLGVVNIFGELKQQFNIEDLALLAAAGDQIGVAVENYRLRQQAEQTAVLKERERLARDLHDSVTQSLYSLTLFSEGSLELIKSEQLGLVEHNLTRIGETAQQALKEMRLLVYELRPLDLEKEGFVGALHQRLASFLFRACFIESLF